MNNLYVEGEQAVEYERMESNESTRLLRWLKKNPDEAFLRKQSRSIPENAIPFTLS